MSENLPLKPEYDLNQQQELGKFTEEKTDSKSNPFSEKVNNMSLGTNEMIKNEIQSISIDTNSQVGEFQSKQEEVRKRLAALDQAFEHIKTKNPKANSLSDKKSTGKKKDLSNEKTINIHQHLDNKYSQDTIEGKPEDTTLIKSLISNNNHEDIHVQNFQNQYNNSGGNLLETSKNIEPKNEIFAKSYTNKLSEDTHTKNLQNFYHSQPGIPYEDPRDLLQIENELNQKNIAQTLEKLNIYKRASVKSSKELIHEKIKKSERDKKKIQRDILNLRKSVGEVQNSTSFKLRNRKEESPYSIKLNNESKYFLKKKSNMNKKIIHNPNFGINWVSQLRADLEDPKNRICSTQSPNNLSQQPKYYQEGSSGSQRRVVKQKDSSFHDEKYMNKASIVKKISNHRINTDLSDKSLDKNSIIKRLDINSNNQSPLYFQNVSDISNFYQSENVSRHRDLSRNLSDKSGNNFSFEKKKANSIIKDKYPIVKYETTQQKNDEKRNLPYKKINNLDEKLLNFDKRHCSLGKENAYSKREPDFPINLNINLTKKSVQRSKRSNISPSIGTSNNYTYLSKKKKSTPKVTIPNYSQACYNNLIKLPLAEKPPNSKDQNKRGVWVNNRDSVGGRNSIKSGDKEQFNVRLSNGSQILNEEYIVNINNVKNGGNTIFKDAYTNNSQEDFRLSHTVEKSLNKSRYNESVYNDDKHDDFGQKSKQFLENLKNRDKALKNSMHVITKINKGNDPNDQDAKSDILNPLNSKRRHHITDRNNSVDLDLEKIKISEPKVNVKNHKRKETMELPLKNVPTKIASPKQSSRRTVTNSQSIDMDNEIKEAQKLIASQKEFFMNSSIGEV